MGHINSILDVNYTPKITTMKVENVVISSNIQSSITEFFAEKNYSVIGIICDENTAEHCLPKIIDILPEHWLIEIESGEKHKILQTCEQIWTALTEGKFDRNSLLINLGGGVIGDMGGFVASTFKRGIDFINIPTTLLAQVDASVGGKLGIDFMGLKNHIGLFCEPTKVLVDTVFLETLPLREIRSGYAEILKHGLIADKAYWNDVKSLEINNTDWKPIVAHSIGIKKEVVKADPFESGLRKTLNFGHTIGHAIETTFLSGENHLLHGEAIAIGMICEAYLSSKYTGLSIEDLNTISLDLMRIYTPNKIAPDQFEHIVELTFQDKKNQGNIINCSLLKDIGECTVNIPISEPDILDALFFFNKLTEV